MDEIDSSNHTPKLVKEVHVHVVKYTYAGFVAVANSLVNRYKKCGNIHYVPQVFDKVPERDDVSWNLMIAAACRFELWEMALPLMMVCGLGSKCMLML
ncbi:hypothetical protein PIB30_089595 [Stylosanthes scabra]|uniref:Uncharacterized protein n=1 Tax=Stylosanthes scabra TaxID=79078 RepID=A0ABU6ZSR6_9FABA|nr:hypothetical protein [Stylosanthes scabra]